METALLLQSSVSPPQHHKDIHGWFGESSLAAGTMRYSSDNLPSTPAVHVRGGQNSAGRSA